MYDYKWFKNIKRVLQPFNYNKPSGNDENDIAVIELEEAFESNYVRPACLETVTDLRYEGPFMVGV